MRRNAAPAREEGKEEETETTLSQLSMQSVCVLAGFVFLRRVLEKSHRVNLRYSLRHWYSPV